MRHRGAPFATFALATLTAATITACGGGDVPEPSGQETPTTQRIPEGVFGMAPTPDQGTPSVVTLRTLGAADAAPPSAAVVLDQLGLAFTPTQALARVGQTVRFVNSETLAHNVHVIFMDTDSSVFMADMDPQDQTQITLDVDGGYDVTCDVHPGMRAFLFVTSAPYAAIADVDGHFSIPDVPPGRYAASVWSVSPDARSEREVEVSGPSTELDLTTFP